MQSLSGPIKLSGALEIDEDLLAKFHDIWVVDFWFGGILPMVLRALIVAQIASVALLGAATRGTLLAPSVRGLPESAAALGFYPVFLGFPLGVLIASRRAVLPSWKRHVILGIEAALSFATLVAILPAVQ